MKNWLANKYAYLLLGLLGLVILFSLLGYANKSNQENEKNAATTLWMLGVSDDSSAEFKGGAGKESVTLDVQAASATALKAAGGAAQAVKTSSPVIQLNGSIPPGLNAETNPELVLEYELDTIPANGVRFNVRILDASKAVPQMAVFSNNQLSGMIQIAGVAGTGSQYTFKSNYQLYIPKEQLQTGVNQLKLRVARCLYCSEAENSSLWWTWDSLNLEKLASPAAEPIHGSYIRTGTNVNNNEFYYDKGATRHLPAVMKWLGIAYSGNIMRVTCASNVGNACSDLDNYYKTLKQYNMQAVALYLYTGDIKLNADGTLPDSAKQKLTSYLQKYGPYVQYFEVDNEPGLFNRSKAVNLAVAQWLNSEGKKIAPYMKTVAPGWAYWPAYSVKSCKNQTGDKKECGNPDGWERDPKQRLELENVTDLTNGHAYGESYVQGRGGSFVENLQTFSGSKDGLSKTMLNTEFGTSDSHTDNPIYGASQPQAAVFDRIMRSQIGYADMLVQHAAFYKDFTLFETGFDLNNHNPANTQIHEFSSGLDSRVDIMRRLSLAYATHGKPLTYEVLNKSETADKMVYVRAVDTSTLDPLPGSSAKSNKLLVNLVNFEPTTQHIKVRVTMPNQGTYQGERFGPGDTYAEAQTTLTGLQASPTLDFEETLGPGESVQYILAPAKVVDGVSTADVSAPDWVTANVSQDGDIKVDWTEAEGALAYDVLRAEGTDGPYQVIASAVEATNYSDTSVKAGVSYTYKIRAAGSGKISPGAKVEYTGLAALDRTAWKASASPNKANARLAIDSSTRTRWDTGIRQSAGAYYQVDLGKTSRIGQITLDGATSENDYPRAYDVLVSVNGTDWTKINSGRGSGSWTDIRFNPIEARYVKIVLTEGASMFWSIHELQVYAQLS
ncbi:discoidin domain-containing protein [Paenibacillus jiagnxiensis]|uniref:discoidin domain-containing protein n=1 Tax=Paenibacillus jiagnxiensis TaxID=3228926 RepID=UPI0033B48B1D